MQEISIIQAEERLAAYVFLPEDRFNYFLIISHGFRGTKENGGKIFDFAQRLNALGFAVLAFDFSGSGNSDGNFDDVSLSRQAKDLKAVMAYVNDKYHLPLILLGRSFGGSTVLAAGAGDERVAAYVFWSTPVRLQETFKTILGDEDREKIARGESISIRDDAGVYQIKPALFNDFAVHRMGEYMGSIKDRPVLIVHGLADEVVDPANARELYSKLTNAELVLVENADHRFVNKYREREEITIQWLQANFA
jgi:putative redox protein